MLKGLRRIISNKATEVVIFDETKLTDEEWIAWKIRSARHVGFKGEFKPEEILASRKKPYTDQKSTHSKEAE